MNKTMNGVIYKVLNKVNGKIYIGQSINFEKRKYDHIRDSYTNRDNSIIHQAIRKYGIEQFEWSIIWEGDKDLLNEMEVYFIKEYKTFIHSQEYDGSNGYNMTIGGGGNSGFKISEETRLKLSNAAKGRKHTEETKIKLKNINIGRKHTIESKLKIAECKRNISDETRLKISNAQKGKHTGELNYMFNKAHSIETKLKMSENRSSSNLYSFIHINGEIEENITQNSMCKKYNLHKTNISKLIKGKQKITKGWSLYKKEDIL